MQFETEAPSMADEISLRDYIDLRFRESTKAIEKAEESMNSRLEGMNEFRSTLKDQASRFVTREEVSLMLKPLEKTTDKSSSDIESLQLTRAMLSGKASQTSVYITLLFSLASLVLGIVGILK